MTDSSTSAPVELPDEFDPVKSMEWLKAHGVEVETVEDRERKKHAAANAASAENSVAFTFIKLPFESTEPVTIETGRYVPGGGGDILPSLLAPRFADDGSLDEDVVARETAGRLKGMMMHGGDGLSLKAPSAQALADQACAGSCEAWPLAQPSEANDFRKVCLYIDEVGALRARPRNPRAEALANACGLAGVPIHGDAYVGRTARIPEGGERNTDFAIAELDHESAWVLAARRNHGDRAQALELRDDEHLASGSDGAADGSDATYRWTQGEEDVEVCVLKGIPENGKKRIKVTYGKGRSLSVSVDGTTVLDLPKLFDRISPDECSWSLDKDVLVVTMEKSDARPWAKLTLPQ